MGDMDAPTYTPPGRAALAVAVSLRDTADHARDLIDDLPTPMPTRDRIRKFRDLRVLALRALDRTVLTELLAGATWDEVADGLCRPVEDVQRMYERTLAMWTIGSIIDHDAATIFGDFTVGLLHDHDPAGTAESIDAWVARHGDPWDGDAPVMGPVQRALYG